MTEKLSKQDSHKRGGETKRENFSAEEVAQESSYNDSTEVAQQMLQGEQAKGDPNKLSEAADSPKDNKS